MRQQLAAVAMAGTLLLALPATAHDINKALDAFKQGDYPAALHEWRPLAEKGDAGAQHQLGYLYHYGHGVPQDYVLAVEWYRKSAEQGYAVGQSYLGFMYNYGLGVPRNDVEGHKWYNLAAAQGLKEGIRLRDAAAIIMKRSEILEAQRLAREWLAEHSGAE